MPRRCPAARPLPRLPSSPAPASTCFLPPAELENHLGIADKTLSEFIVELSKGKASVKEFRLALRENGADMPDSLVETLWAIIQRMLPGGKPGGKPDGGGAGPSGLQPRPDAPFAGLAMPDTRDRVKQMEEEMLAEARAKAEADTGAERQRSHEQASTRNGREADGRGRGGREERNRDGPRYRSRSRSPGGGGRRRRSRSRSRERYRRRSPSPRGGGGRREEPLPDEPEMYGVYRVRACV